MIQKIPVALEQIHSPTSTNFDRRDAYVFLESVKKSEKCNEIGRHLFNCNNGFSDIIRHFGLTLLEDTIRLRWNELNQEQKLSFQQIVCDVLLNVSHFLPLK